MTPSPSTGCGRLAILLISLGLAGCAGDAMTRPTETTETGGSGGSPGTGGSAETGGSSGLAGKGGSGPTDVPGEKLDAHVDPETPADAGAPADTGGPADSGGSVPMGVTASPACGGTAVMPAPNGNQTIMANGKSRTFIVRPPSNYDGKKPLAVLFLMHGAGGGASSFEGGAFGTISKMAADKAWRIFPQAFGGNTWSRDEPDDVMFMRAIVKWLDEKACYDKGAVFSTGQSSGAYFSHRFACDCGDIVRAVATNSGGQRKERVLDCKTPVSSWTSTGLQDDPGHVMGTRQADEVWRKLAGCSMDTVPTGVGPCKAYKGCNPGYAVHHCEHGGGHPLPNYGVEGIYGFLFGGKYTAPIP
jgi:poly(3-hydroxybutyrate) depolymerase